MKASDYDNIIAKISNPDTQAEGLVELTDKLKVDEQEYEANQKSITDLRDSNQKLFLRATSSVPEDKSTQDDEEVDDFEALQAKIKANIGG